MIVTLCAIAASLGGAIFCAQKVTAPKTAKIVFTPQDKVSFIKEQHLLAKTLIDEVKRIEKQTLKKPADLDLVVNSFETIMRTAWRKETYYDRTSVSPFLKTLNISLSLEREDASSEFLALLAGIIRLAVPNCSEAVVRGEDGNDVNEFSTKAMSQLRALTVKLEQNNRKRIDLIKYV